MTIEFTDTSPTTAKGLDQFYTAPDLAADCIDQVLSDYADQPFDTIIEPSAGTGAFSERLGSDCIALDLDPKAAEIQTADFLTWQPKTYSGRCLVIGNPPFSKSAALKFLNHAAEFAEVVAFILPATFKKKSQQKPGRREHALGSPARYPRAVVHSCRHGGGRALRLTDLGAWRCASPAT